MAASIISVLLLSIPAVLLLKFISTSPGQYAPHGQAPDDGQATRQRTLRIYILAAMVLGPLYTSFFLLFGAAWTAAGPGFFALTTTASYLLFRRGRPREAAVLLAWSIWIAPGWCVVTTSGLYSPLLIWMAPGPFMAGPLLGKRAAAWAGLASVLFVVAMGLLPAGYPGVVEMNEGVGKPLLFVLCGTTAIGLIAFYSWSTTGHYEEARQAMHDKNAELSALVQQVEAGSQAMRRVLDNVAQGLMVIDGQGAITGQWSRAVERWFGPPRPGQKLADLVGGVDLRASQSLTLAFDSLAEGWMPEEIILDQMPKEVRAAGRLLGLTVHRLGDGGLMAVFTDLTEQRAHERAEAQQANVIALFRCFRRDRAGVLTFLTETEHLMSCLAGASCKDKQAVARDLHTVKGNAGVFGLELLARRAHALEDLLLETGALPREEVQDFLELWQALVREIRVLIGSGADTRVELDQSDLTDLLAALEGTTPREQIVRQVRELAWDPLRQPLLRLGEQARALAQRLGKAPVDVHVNAPRVRADRDQVGPVMAALVHVIRNAVDHGVETDAERAQAGKAAHATLALSAARLGEDLLLEVRDDGRGVDWDRLAQKAKARGLPTETRQDLVDALFADGVSTRDEATDVSGRGVGMAALKAEVEKLGGEVRVESAPGKGTAFIVALPIYRAVMAPLARAA